MQTESTVDAATGEWPRPVGGHLIVRSVDDGDSQTRTEYRCVDCGLTTDHLDSDLLGRIPCETKLPATLTAPGPVARVTTLPATPH